MDVVSTAFMITQGFITLRNEVHDPLDWDGTAEASFLVVVVSQLPPLALFNLPLEAIANRIQ